MNLDLINVDNLCNESIAIGTKFTMYYTTLDVQPLKKLRVIAKLTFDNIINYLVVINPGRSFQLVRNLFKEGFPTWRG